MGRPAAETVAITTGRDAAGADVFGFLVKRAYRIDEAGACRREPTPPFQSTDAYWDDPEHSSPRLEAELVAFKPATDVVVMGHAHAPGGQANACRIAIEIGAARRTIAVFGDRVATRQRDGIAFSPPRPFSRLPVVFERAYGGSGYPRNPVGCGYVVGEMPAAPVALPNFEDPEDLLTPGQLVLAEAKHWNRAKLPRGLGWFGKTWYPRMSFAGVIPGDVDADETMREEALGLVPRGQIALGRQFRLPSWDARFANGAAPGLAVGGLRGDETARLLNLTADGRLSFTLPGERPVIAADIGAGETRLESRLHSVVIEPDLLRVTLIWGACLVYPGAAWLPHMKRLSGRVA